MHVIQDALFPGRPRNAPTRQASSQRSCEYWGADRCVRCGPSRALDQHDQTRQIGSAAPTQVLFGNELFASLTNSSKQWPRELCG